MKRAKRIYVLLGVLAVVCVAAFAVVHYQEEQERIANTDEVILELDTDAVESLSWSYDDQSLAFHKDEHWIYDEDEAFPVDEEKINALLEQFQSFGASFIIEDVTDFGQYGLDDPACTIDIATADTSYEIQLGDFSTMDSQRYVSIGDGNVYLVQNDPMDSFEITIRDLIDNDETPDFDQVSSIQFSGEDSYEVVWQEENTYTACADDHYFVQEGNAWLPLDTSRVESYLSTISSLDPDDYVTYTAGEENLDAFGLDDPELTVPCSIPPRTRMGTRLRRPSPSASAGTRRNVRLPRQRRKRPIRRRPRRTSPPMSASATPRSSTRSPAPAMRS